MIKKDDIYWIIQRVIENILDLFGPKDKFVLMGHEVSDDVTKWYDKDYSIKASSMINMIEHIKELGYEFDSIDNISGNKNKKVYLTFDDGFESVYRELYPYLKENKIPFCVFVTYDFIGKKGYMDANMIKDIAEDKVGIIGAHTLSHPALRKKEKSEADKEISMSKICLEKLLSRDVLYFAYPYGCISRCSVRNIKQVKRAGFKYGFSTLNTGAWMGSSYFIPRINVCEDSFNIILNRMKRN